MRREKGDLRVEMKTKGEVYDGCEIIEYGLLDNGVSA